METQVKMIFNPERLRFEQLLLDKLLPPDQIERIKSTEISFSELLNKLPCIYTNKHLIRSKKIPSLLCEATEISKENKQIFLLICSLAYDLRILCGLQQESEKMKNSSGLDDVAKYVKHNKQRELFDVAFVQSMNLKYKEDSNKVKIADIFLQIRQLLQRAEQKEGKSLVFLLTECLMREIKEEFKKFSTKGGVTDTNMKDIINILKENSLETPVIDTKILAESSSKYAIDFKEEEEEEDLFEKQDKASWKANLFAIGIFAVMGSVLYVVTNYRK